MIVANIENNRLTLLLVFARVGNFVGRTVSRNHTGVLRKMSFVKQLDRKTSLL